ncbi:type VII secretion target [Saccharopolyspora sp. NPDC049426]|uniref:type VII secretion target n=1 Tax=Saccharopolyspora sp. NPDC049426 TaxID=3155652 RepID=UPI0034173FBC
MTSFKVQAEDLTAHASHLEALTDRVDTALSAAETVSMSDEAYGLLCSFLPPIVNPMEEEGINALKAAKEGITVTADNVRSSAKDYQETDDANSDELKKFDEAVKVKQSAVALRGVPAVDSGGGTPQQQGTPLAEPMQQGVSPQQQAVSPVMRSEPREEPLRPTEPGTPA